LIPGSSYHPQGNGKCEHFNGDLTTLLAKRVLDSQDRLSKWNDHLEGAVFDYNNHVNRMTGVSPYQYVFGQKPRFPTDPIREYTEDELQDLRVACAEVVVELRTHALSLHQDERRKEVELMEEKYSEPISYAPGDLVWLWRKELESTYATSKKLEESWSGPYRIVKRTGPGTYKLSSIDGTAELETSVSHMRMRPVRTKPNLVQDKLGVELVEDISLKGLFYDDSSPPSTFDFTSISDLTSCSSSCFLDVGEPLGISEFDSNSSGRFGGMWADEQFPCFLPSSVTFPDIV
jgi:hypothetical protein